MFSGKRIILIFSLMFTQTLVTHWPARNPQQSRPFQAFDISVAFHQGRSWYLSKICSDIEYVKLETRPDFLVERTDIVEIGKKFIALADTRKGEVLLFTRDGKIVKRLGRLGKGPGEFGSLNSVSLSWSERWVAIFDSGRGKVMLFDTGSDQIREIVVPGGASQVIFGPGNLLLASYTYPISSTNANCQFSWIDISDGSRKPFARVPESVQSWSSLVVPVRRMKDEMVVDQLYNDTIYRISPNGFLEPRLSFGLGSNRLPAESYRSGELFAKNVTNHTRYTQWIHTGKWIFINAMKGTQLKRILYDVENSSAFSLITFDEYRNMVIDNNVDGGPAFWFDCITHAGEPAQLVTTKRILDLQKAGYLNKYHLLNSGAGLKFQKLLSEISEGQNPVIQILK